MRILGPHLIGIVGQPAQFYKASPYEQIFAWLEQGSASVAITRGDWLLWDTTDYTDPTGGKIFQDTLGQRVLKLAGANSALVAGCAEEAQAALAGDADVTRGSLGLVQIYGYHDASHVTLGAAAPVGTPLAMSSVAGTATEALTQVATTPVPQVVGATLIAGSGGGGAQTLPVFVRCMGG